MTLGQKLSPIYSEIEEQLWEQESRQPNVPLEFTIEGFRGALKIFMSALLDMMWNKQQLENMPIKEREFDAHTAGHEIKALVDKYTNIDTHKLYEKGLRKEVKI